MYRLLFLIVHLIIAQTAIAQFNPDEAFKRARTHAFDGQRSEAISVCDSILKLHPGYHEVRVFKARVLAWEKEYNIAREQLFIILDKDPIHLDATLALVDIEYWSGNYEKARDIAHSALLKYRTNEELLLRKAKAAEKMDNLKEAAAIAKQLLEINPAHEEAALLFERIKKGRLVNKLTSNYSVEQFNQVYDNRHLASLEYSRKMKRASWILRLNYADRFGRQGSQVETDIYPKLRKGTYGYLNFGFSDSPLFPSLRYGAEIYQKLPHSFEASVGGRYLGFTSKGVLIYTASIGKYTGNYWLAGRTFLTPKQSGVSHSFLLSVRRYFKNAENHVTLIASTGNSPDDRIQDNSTYYLSSYGLAAQLKVELTPRLYVRARVGGEREELVFRRSDYVTVIRASAGLQYWF